MYFMISSVSCDSSNLVVFSLRPDVIIEPGYPNKEHTACTLESLNVKRDRKYVFMFPQIKWRTTKNYEEAS